MTRLGRSLGATDLRLDDGADTPVNDGIDVLDSDSSFQRLSTQPPEPPESSRLSRWLTPVALVVAILAAAALVTRTGPAPTPVAPTTTIAPITTTVPDPLAELDGPVDPPLLQGEVVAIGTLDEPIPDVLVAPVQGGYLVIDPSTGTIERISAGFDPDQLEAGSPGSLLAVTGDRLERSELRGDTWQVVSRDVEVVRPSTTPGAVWLRRSQVAGLFFEITDDGSQLQDVFNLGGEIDPRYRWEPGGGTFDVTNNLQLVGQHQLLAVGQTELLGRICDARAQCRLELWPNADEGWQPLRRAQNDIAVASFNRDGSWIMLELDSGGIQLVSAEVGSTFIRMPNSTDIFHIGRFSSDGAFLYLLSQDELEIVTLGTFERRSVDLPPEVVGLLDDWTVVAS